MGSFAFKLEHKDGTPAEPSVLHTAVPNWAPGNTIAVGSERTLRVVEVRPVSGPLDDPVLVVRADKT